MTDFTELAQSLKAAAEKATPGGWGTFQYYSGHCGISGGRNAEIMVCEHISKERQQDAEFIALANPANILALVEALEKAQTENTAGAAGMAESYETTISMLRSRIAELEESHAQVIQSRDHYKRMSEEGLKQLEESRTVTVKLPPKIERNDADGWFMYNGGRVGGGAAEWYNKALDDVGSELTGSGIKWEAE